VPMLRGTRAFANARYTGPQYCLHAEAGGEVRLGATTETSFALERRITVSRSGSVRSLRALLSLDNAGNLAIYDQCGLPQPGRTLRLMLAFQ
jgi:iron complex outermembrane recepter protein